MTEKNKTGLPWHLVESAVNKEIDWLKKVIPTRKQGVINKFDEFEYSKCENCDFMYRKIALLVIRTPFSGHYILGLFTLKR